MPENDQKIGRYSGGISANDMMRDWNVVATAYEGSFRAAKKILRAYGDVVQSDFQNVLLLRVDDPEKFLKEFLDAVAAEPGILNSISRLVPAHQIFDFQNPVEFEERAREAALRLAPSLAGKRFHARVHRRGFKHRISSHDEEQRLNETVLASLAAAGTPASIAFNDPDSILSVETVGQHALVSLWTREQLQRYPFLRLD